MTAVSAGLAGVATDDRSCALCEAPPDTVPTPRHGMQRDDVIAWLGVLAAAVLAASFGDGVVRWIGVGAIVALGAGAACAAFSVRLTVEALRNEHTHAIHQLEEDADSRVTTVIRQFEWAVNDVVHLKRQVEKAEAAVDTLLGRAQERERYLRTLEHALADAHDELARLAGPIGEPGPFAPAADAAPHFRWALHHDGHRANLELEALLSSHAPKRVRIVDAAGEIVMTSGTPMRTEDGVTLFSLSRPPEDLLAALEAHREHDYGFQAFVDFEWREITVEDTGRRTKVVMDKQGRSYRVTDTERMFAAGSPAFAQLN